MLNFNRQNRPEGKDADKTVLRPAIYDPPASTLSRAGSATTRQQNMQVTNPPEPSARAPEPAPQATPAAAPASASAPAVATDASSAVTSTLSVGPNIKLKGVEISDCDVLAIEGHVEATVHSSMMRIAQPGTLSGTAHIDVAEIEGHFTGELTARTRLIVHGTGRVSGKIRYGKLVVSEGGEISGDIQQIDSTEAPPRSTSHNGTGGKNAQRTAADTGAH